MSRRIEDLVEIQQLLARYAVTITQEDIDGLVAVFTPDGTYSAFGETYSLDRFPVLVDAAPKGLFMTATPVIELDGDAATGPAGGATASSARFMAMARRIGGTAPTPRSARLRTRAAGPARVAARVIRSVRPTTRRAAGRRVAS